MSSSNYKIRLPSTVLKYRNVPSNLLFAKILDRKNNSTERSRIATSTFSTYDNSISWCCIKERSITP